MYRCMYATGSTDPKSARLTVPIVVVPAALALVIGLLGGRAWRGIASVTVTAVRVRGWRGRRAVRPDTS